MKYRGVFVPFGKMQPDQPPFGEGVEAAESLLFLDGAYQRVRAELTKTGVHGYSEQKLRDAQWIHTESAAYLYAATSGHLFEVNTSTGALTDRCKAGHYTASTWSLLPFGAIMVAASSDNPLQAVTPGGAFADLATSATKPRGKYLCSCRGHIILGNITAPAVNPREIRWSGRYEPTDWEPGSNRSGFNEFFSDAGVITGLAGFEDFFLIFTSKAVIRASFIGGDAVWSYQQVGSLHDGMPLGMWRSVAAVGRDAYYLSRTGPKVVVSGEAVRDLAAGSVRRVMLDSDRRLSTSVLWSEVLSIPFASTWTPAGCVDALRPIVVWAYLVPSGTWANHSILLWCYSLEDGAFTFITASPNGFTRTKLYENVIVASRDFGAALTPPSGVLPLGTSLLASDPEGLNIKYTTFEAPVFHARGKIVSKLSDFGPGQTALFAIRPRIQFVESATITELPLISVLVRAWDDLPLSTDETPDREATIADVYGALGAATATDARGFAFIPSGPLRGAFFQFVVTVQDVTGTETRKIRGFSGLDVLLDPEKSDR